MQLISRTFLTWTAAALLASALSAGSNVWVVDASNGPGADFTELQLAVDAASDGDTLLVRSGTYAGLSVSNKALTIAADVGASVETTAPVEVELLAAGKAFSVSGFAMRSSSLSPSLAARDCTGPIHVQDCEIRILDTGTFITGDAAQVQRCNAVNFTRVFVQGDSAQTPFITGSGILAEDSNLSLFDSTVVGPPGMTGDPNGTSPGLAGGPGISMAGGSLLLSDTQVTGGTGGLGGSGGVFMLCSDGGPGGAALLFFDGDSTGTPLVRTLGATLAGGAGGTAVQSCADGAPGPATQGSATEIDLPVTPRHYSATSPIRTGETFVSTYAGLAGDLVFGLFSTSAFPTPFLPQANGAIWPSIFALSINSSGTLPASGATSTTFPVSFAGVSVELTIQALFFDALEGYVLSNPESVLFLGPGL